VADQFERAIAAIDAANSADPTGAALLYGQRMSARLDAFGPDASDELRIAVRAQHIRRWEIPRSSFPDGRVGYKQWRSELGRFHAAATGEILDKCSYGAEFKQRVATMLTKKGLRSDREVQTLEDVACLVFLEHYSVAFADKHAEDKVVDIIGKTWRKMSERGHTTALELRLDPRLRQLVERAVSD
jgi:hypothetical protein